MAFISINGRLGKDAEILTAQNGRQYVRFSVAENTYYKGEECTTWYDVTCYDNFVAEKRSKILTKGTFVIVRGEYRTEVKPYNGKAWINHYITATSIEVPRTGANQNNNDTQREVPQEVSVYTANTQSSVVAPQPAYATAPAAAAEMPMTTGMPSIPSYEPNFSDSDDLPF